MGLKPCLDCGSLSPGSRCPEHEAARRSVYERARSARRPSTAARGYSGEHVRVRRSWVDRIAAGELVTCARCGQRITPDTPFDLGHDDSDPTHTRYLGPEHQRCSRRAGGRRRRAP